MRVFGPPWPAGILAAALFLAGSLPVQSDASWLDNAVSDTANWNTAGMSLPSARTSAESIESIVACPEMVRPAETVADQAVAAAGWALVAMYRSGWGIATVDGTSGFDGMCRPSGEMEFVFVDGTFAGTTTPVPVHMGSEGSGGVLSIGSGNLSAAVFERFRSHDPHCCPSGHTDVRYRVDRTDAGPVLVAFQADTFWKPAP